MTLLGFLGVTPPGNIDNFTRAYLETALWAENGGNYETYQKRGFSLNDFTRKGTKGTKMYVLRPTSNEGLELEVMEKDENGPRVGKGLFEVIS